MTEETIEPEELFRRSKNVVNGSGFCLIHVSTTRALIFAVIFGLVANNAAESGDRAWSFLLFGGAIFVAFRPYPVRER